MTSSPDANFAIPTQADSIAGAKFFEQHARDLSWVVGQEVLAREVESFSNTLAGALKEHQTAPKGIDQTIYDESASLAAASIERRGRQARMIVQQNHPVIFETALCRYVDNFLSYLSDILTIIFMQNPESITDNDSPVTVRDIFIQPDLESLRVWLIEKKINDLSFQGLGNIENYCQKRFGLTLLPDTEARKSIEVAIAARNLLVHRRGIIDARFVRFAGEDMGRIGSRIAIGKLVWTELLPAILASVRSIDERVAKKFRLQAAFVVPNDQIAEDNKLFLAEVARQVMGWSSIVTQSPATPAREN